MGKARALVDTDGVSFIATVVIFIIWLKNTKKNHQRRHATVVIFINMAKRTLKKIIKAPLSEIGIQLFVSFQRAGLDRLMIKIKAARRKLTIERISPPTGTFLFRTSSGSVSTLS